MSAQPTVFDHVQYWASMNSIKQSSGAYPSFVFDFISVHGDKKIGYSLCSPMCLVDPKTGNRPKWEQDTHTAPSDAINAALLIAAENSVLVVDFISYQP